MLGTVKQKRVEPNERSAAKDIDNGSQYWRGLPMFNLSRLCRLAVDMDIHGYIRGYIHVWISDLGYIH